MLIASDNLSAHIQTEGNKTDCEVNYESSEGKLLIP